MGARTSNNPFRGLVVGLGSRRFVHDEGRLRTTSADEPVEPPIVESPAAGLTRRAVRHLVRLVAHSAKIGSADGTGLPMAPVDSEMVSQPGRQSTGASAFHLQRV